MEEDKIRVAIIDSDRCRPKKCRQECRRSCPVVMMGKLCIEVKPSDSIATLSESLCIGCGQCAKKCPFGAIQIINLPKSLESETIHRFGTNGFKLHRLPTPRPGQVLGLVGINGIGKSTALKILANKIKPNLGQVETGANWESIIRYFRGSELQAYFTNLINDSLTAYIKPQYVDQIPKLVQGRVGDILEKKKPSPNLISDLDLKSIWDRDIADLSGGELQRVAIAVTAAQKADIYIFDEPSSYLDIYQRLRVARTIRSILTPTNYIIAVEHDLAVLDYLSDFICCLYGTPGAYGVISLPFSVREGINVFLSGYLPTENLRFRETELTFRIRESEDPLTPEESRDKRRYDYPSMRKTFYRKEDPKVDFRLDIKSGYFTDSEIIVLFGRNGTGKTTFIRLLAGLVQPDEEDSVPKLNISYKPQMISPKFLGSVRELFYSKIQEAYYHPQFIADVIKPLSIEGILDSKVKNLSGGELQRVSIALCLGKPADLYLLDEPSAYLDSEQRIQVARIIKRFILNSKKTAFIVEHDLMMAAYLADRVIVYQGEPSKNCVAGAPESVVEGLNRFLQQMGITVRRDPTNGRPRINKSDSVLDREQKSSGNYFSLEK